jgi:hypothetical protein
MHSDQSHSTNKEFDKHRPLDTPEVTRITSVDSIYNRGSMQRTGEYRNLPKLSE